MVTGVGVLVIKRVIKCYLLFCNFTTWEAYFFVVMSESDDDIYTLYECCEAASVGDSLGKITACDDQLLN